MKITDYFRGLRDQGDREIGIEIEMEGGNLFPPILNYWHATEDGSLRPNPQQAEYVLRQPVRRSRVRSRLEYLSATLAKNKAELRPSDRCGVHVHLNVQGFEMEEFFKLVTLYYLFENVLTHWCGEDREGNLFCLRAKDAESLMEELITAKSSGEFGYITTNSYRYSALNFAALRKYGSVEFRAMRTPEDLMRVTTWVGLILKMRDYTRNKLSEQDIVKKVSAIGPLALSREVFGDKFRLIDYPGYEDQIMESLDMAQNLAYTPISPSLIGEATASKKRSTEDSTLSQMPPIPARPELAQTMPRRPRSGTVPEPAPQVRVDPFRWRWENVAIEATDSPTLTRTGD